MWQSDEPRIACLAGGARDGVSDPSVVPLIEFPETLPSAWGNVAISHSWSFADRLRLSALGSTRPCEVTPRLPLRSASVKLAVNTEHRVRLDI
jgi:hypothetical protein